MTPAAGAISAWLTRKYFRGAEGSGIPQVIAALRSNSSQSAADSMRTKIMVGKILVSWLALTGGLTIGREGPSVHIGAAIMFNLRHLHPTRLSRDARIAFERSLLLAGAACGLAAAFNTPLAGFVFAFEQLCGRSMRLPFKVMAMSIALSTLVTRAIDGNFTFFASLRPLEFHAVKSMTAVFAFAIVTGAAGGAFAWLFANSERWLPPFLNSMRAKTPLPFGALCGLVVAVIGYVSGWQTVGSGYAEARGIIGGQIALPTAYPILKIASLLASSLVGAPGGIFVPTLAIGAGIGNLLHTLMPVVPPHAAIALAMAGYLSAVTQRPITAFVIVMEMSNLHVLLPPLMAVAFIASAVSRVFTTPLYETLSLRYR
jgi:H+/Cl- antiporter ClcA